MYLCHQLNDDLKWPSRKHGSLCVELQILTALRFYATWSFQSVIGDTHGISIPTVSRCIHRVSVLLSRYINEYISFAREENGIRALKQGFYDTSNFHNVVGAVDGSLIPIKKPPRDEHLFVWRKGFHAINMQAICNAKLKFVSAVIQYPGSTHDSFVWNNSAISRKFRDEEMGSGWLLGDSGYVEKEG